jgi:hypothetical protein
VSLEGGDEGDVEGSSTESEECRTDRVELGLEEVCKGLKKCRIDERFAFLIGEGKLT